jgi:hypothetical protein
MASGQLQSYSTQQLSTLLDQRTHVSITTPSDLGIYIISSQLIHLPLNQRLIPRQVLDVAKRHSRDLELYRHNEKIILNPFSILGSDISDATKLWVPNPQDECQFKVCHRCRHVCLERSYLSLDAIANDEIPMTAVAGFGFNLLGKRPVVPRKCAINYGLRPYPRPQTVSISFSFQVLDTAIFKYDSCPQTITDNT